MPWKINPFKPGNLAYRHVPGSVPEVYLINYERAEFAKDSMHPASLPFYVSSHPNTVFQMFFANTTHQWGGSNVVRIEYWGDNWIPTSQPTNFVAYTVNAVPTVTDDMTSSERNAAIYAYSKGTGFDPVSFMSLYGFYPTLNMWPYNDKEYKWKPQERVSISWSSTNFIHNRVGLMLPHPIEDYTYCYNWPLQGVCFIFHGYPPSIPELPTSCLTIHYTRSWRLWAAVWVNQTINDGGDYPVTSPYVPPIPKPQSREAEKPVKPLIPKPPIPPLKPEEDNTGLGISRLELVKGWSVW